MLLQNNKAWLIFRIFETIVKFIRIKMLYCKKYSIFYCLKWRDE